MKLRYCNQLLACLLAVGSIFVAQYGAQAECRLFGAGDEITHQIITSSEGEILLIRLPNGGTATWPLPRLAKIEAVRLVGEEVLVQLMQSYERRYAKDRIVYAFGLYNIVRRGQPSTPQSPVRILSVQTPSRFSNGETVAIAVEFTDERPTKPEPRPLDITLSFFPHDPANKLDSRISLAPDEYVVGFHISGRDAQFILMTNNRQYKFAINDPRGGQIVESFRWPKPPSRLLSWAHVVTVP